MHKTLLFLLFIGTALTAQVQNVTFEVSPAIFQEDDEITITVSNVNPAAWGVTDIYLWAWSSDLNFTNEQDAPNNGTWSNSNEAHKLTNMGNGTYTITFVPTQFYGRTGIGSIGFLVKAKDGTGDKKSQDALYNVGQVEVPPVTEAPVPNGMLDGINLNPADPTKVILVLYAPMKEFVYLIGDFNDWQKNDNYLLKKDSAKNRFWIELAGLTPEFDHKYQYLVDGTMRIADPYSTVILDESNDQFIDAVTYPNLPAYPAGKTSHAVTLLRTGEEVYNWEATDFEGPAKTDLVIYELLIRDFDALHSFDAVQARLDYLEDLGVNAIELMPVNEFDGNESWGYNPSFHMALDKYYGTATAFKQFIDACHKRGIAVILDVVYNHASGQNPFYRMWNTSNGGYGGQASADSPFFNPVATHAYSVFNDFNHSKQATRDYVKRTSQYWIDEFHIDGFRWDLTKGFTQNCTASDEGCTGTYQADRVAVLKTYADYQWAMDPDFYIIFEHLGTNSEETEWVNYRLNEGKGIMMWSNLSGPYNESTMGYHDGGKSDFSWIDYKERNWTVPANVSYMESHDEERLMFKNLQYGNASGSYSIKNMSTALEREKIAGAFYFMVPGPKMIWQFGELGYEYSINTCPNGTISNDCRTSNKPIKWDYVNDPERKALYDVWAKLIKLKEEESIFQTSDFTIDASKTSGLKTIKLTNEDDNASLKYLNVIGNFGVTSQSINPGFQEPGIWYDLLNNNQELNVSNVNQLISLQPGEFRVYGNSQVALPVEDFDLLENSLSVYPNPATNSFKINQRVKQIEIYDHTGRLVRSFKGDFYPEQEYDVASLKPSMYFIRISTDLGSSSRRLIVE
jgi:glycosidase